MKTNFNIMMSAAMAIGLLTAGCAKIGDDPALRQDEGEVGKVVLTIQAASPKQATRAATTEEDANAQEMAIVPSAGLKVAIFDEAGVFVKAQSITSLEALEGEGNAGKYQTPVGQAIEIKDGNYFFFVVANDSAGKITLPTGGMMDAWMEGTFTPAFGDDNVLDIAKYTDDGEEPATVTNGFLIGTLWKAAVATNVPAGGTAAEPAVVEVPALGRFSAKVWVSNISEGADVPKNTALKGRFTEAKFTLGSIAKEMTNAGIITTAGRYDASAVGTIVESAVHEEIATSDKFTGLSPAGYNDVNIGDKNPDHVVRAMYATENTTARLDVDGGPQDAQFYGNTTYIMIKNKYVPGAEVYDPADMSAAPTNATGDGGKFWTAIVNGQRLMFKSDPSSIVDLDPNTEGNQGATQIKVYEGGLNYHYFPVQDPGETDVVARNRVLRNHFYEYEITQINDLGKPSDLVPDTTPVEELTDIVFKVTIKNWDKVNGGTIVL